MGKPNSATSPGANQPGSSPYPAKTNSTPSNRDSRITAPQPVDPDKDRELLQQKVHMTQVMFEQAKEDFEKHQRQYVKTPSERLHTQLLEKERTVKTLENQLKQLTGAEDPSTPSFSQGSQRFDIDQESINSWATSLPASDAGSMSDSPQTSPSISPTPVHPNNRGDADDTSLSTRGDSGIEQDSMPMQPEIITIDDEDVNSDEEQLLGVRPWSGHRPLSPFLSKLQSAETCDTGPFSDIRLLEKKPAHMAVLLHYLISNSDPCALFFYIVTDSYKQSAGNTKDLRKWGYEIFSTFLAGPAPLHIEVGESLVAQVNDVLAAGASRNENEAVLRNMFDGCRAALSGEISEQLADFRNKRDLGLGSIFGVHELRENMDKNTEMKMIEKYLMPHLLRCTQDESGHKLSDRDLAMGWALATFFRQVGINKSSSSGILERVQSFIMKDKRGFKIPGSRSAKAKTMKGHQFNLQHFYVPTLCSKCEGLIWGVGYQGFLCQSCEMGVHKQCVEDVVEVCSGKKRGKRASAFIPVLSTSRKPSNPNQQAGAPSYSVTEALSQAMSGEGKSPPHTATEVPGPGVAPTQPLRKEEDTELAGLPTEHSVRSIVNRYQELASPTGPGPGEGEPPDQEDRKSSTNLSRSESLKGKGDKAERLPRRAKSDVDREDMFRAINQQSGSSSASSISNRSVESPSTSSEHVNEALAAARYDSDLEVEELPPLKQVLGEDVCKKLKPKEKKRQEVINELFHTERAHLRNLKVLDLLFNRPMLSGDIGVMAELARALFPNIEEIISLHASMNKMMKERRSRNPVVGDVGDILLARFDSEPGERFRKACAEYCRNQSFALDALKRHRRKDQRLSQFLGETEADKLCRKLELKDHVPCQMQRLTKYPMLIENLMKYTQSTACQEYKNLERALERSKHILAYVNQAVRECENYHKLKEMQKKLDKRAIDTSTDPNLVEIKKLDLTQHKLVHDGPLVWRLRSHRLIELQVLLLEDILVLLQRADERLVLKCQSTNQLSIGNDYKYTHSPVLKLQNLLARNVATDKKAFFVINTSDAGPQIYELVAQTQDARKTWCRLINEKADEHKKLLAMAQTSHKTQSTPGPMPDEVTEVRSRIMRKSQEPSPPPADEGQAAAPADENADNISSRASTDYQPELIQPDQVSVSGAVTAEARPVLSPLAQLRQQQEQLAQGAAGQNVNIPVPMDQLRGMANEMNSILSNLLSVMGTRGAERQSLRSELQMAQEQLEMLKAIQRQMIAQQPPPTPQSRPQSFISVASSISESGEITDGDNTEDDTGSVLNVAQTQELTQEMVETAEETVLQLVPEVQPQVATAAPLPPNPDDDSDDGYEMIPENLPLPDDNSISTETAFPVTQEEEAGSSVDAVSDREGSTEPMTTDLDDQEGGEDVRGSTTPSPTSTLMSAVGEEGEGEEDRDSVITLSADVSAETKAGGEESAPKAEEAEMTDNNNTSSQDSELTKPIEI